VRVRNGYTYAVADARRLSSLHLSTAHTWRGGENQIWLLARGLAERGHEALVVAPRGAPLLERAREAGLPCRALTLRGELDLAGTARLLQLLREVRPDIVHLHDSHAVLPGQLAAYGRSRDRFAVVAHRRTDFALRTRWKYALRADKVVAISQAVQARLLESGLPPGRVEVVYSGLEFAEPLGRNSAAAAALRRELGLPDQTVVVGHAGALTREKRQADLIAALAQCARFQGAACSGAKGGVGPNVHLVIAGTGQLDEALRALARSFGLGGRVHFLGFRRDLRPVWAVCDMAAYASEAEGLCTALIEAQGAGLPAVITRAGGMPEVVESGVTGLAVSVGEVGELGAAIWRLAGDGALRSKFGEAAYRRARRLFSADAMVEGTLRVYRSIDPASRGAG
jgi:glycosyltransferase involved in cell wall biosynthesis